MSTRKTVFRIIIAAISLALIITVLFFYSERPVTAVVLPEENGSTSGMFTANDMDVEWDTAEACKIVLSGDSAEISGSGASFSGSTLYISEAGKYVISGTLDGSANINTDGKVWLLLDGVDITSKTEPPIYIERAQKVFVTLRENTENMLVFENDAAKNDGCIYSHDDLTVNGKGSLTVISSGLHGIVCNDSLVFTGGNISITAKVDGVHAHDAIRICNASITVSAGDDGLHAGNDDETAVFYMESGNISITECSEGIEANDITIAGGTVYITPSDDGINANGSGRTSMITVSGGDITVINKNGRDADGFDSNGSINITGGNVFISVEGIGTNNAIDYGREDGGRFVISGGTVVACGSSQMAEGPDGESTQGFIMQTISGNAGDVVSVIDANGKEILSKEIPCPFTSVVISSPDITVGDTVTLKIGDTETEITVTNTSENGMPGFGDKGGGRPDGRNDPFGGEPAPASDDTGINGQLPKRPEVDNAPPQKTEGDFRGGNMPGREYAAPPVMPAGGQTA